MAARRKKPAEATGKGISRRAFLSGLAASGAAGAAGAVVAAGALPGKVLASETPLGGKSVEGELATLLDLSKCIGCGACVQACRESNAEFFPRDVKKPLPVMYPKERAKPEDWSGKQDVDDRLTPYNWLFLQSASVEYQGRTHDLTIPRRCMHCQNPPCADLCPWGAAYKQRNGIVKINSDICLGGAKCKKVCPWHIPQRQTGVGLYLDLLPNLAGNGVMYKCTRCHQRVEKGELPACIEACPMEVQKIGPRGEILAEAHALAEETGGFVYGEHENGGTNTFYVSPVPFKLLNKAVDKGAGRPHLKPVENKMAMAENLSWAVVMGPLAGIGAGLLTLAKGLKSGNGPEKGSKGGEHGNGND